MTAPDVRSVAPSTADLDQILQSLERVPLHLDSHEAWNEFRHRIQSLRDRMRWINTHQPRRAATHDSAQAEFDFDESNAILAPRFRRARTKTTRSGAGNVRFAAAYSTNKTNLPASQREA